MYTFLRLISYIGIVLISAKMLYDYRHVFRLRQHSLLRSLWFLFFACFLYGVSGVASVTSLCFGVPIDAVRLFLTPIALFMLFAVYWVMRSFATSSTPEVDNSLRVHNETSPRV